ncbi:MAG: hypothetical protein IPN69_21105 [Acidobacteria bacterium]|nr:hypothetical protein [Acidobacteriota bacterium]
MNRSKKSGSNDSERTPEQAFGVWIVDKVYNNHIREIADPQLRPRLVRIFAELKRMESSVQPPAESISNREIVLSRVKALIEKQKDFEWAARQRADAKSIEIHSNHDALTRQFEKMSIELAASDAPELDISDIDPALAAEIKSIRERASVVTDRISEQFDDLKGRMIEVEYYVAESAIKMTKKFVRRCWWGLLLRDSLWYVQVILWLLMFGVPLVNWINGLLTAFFQISQYGLLLILLGVQALIDVVIGPWFWRRMEVWNQKNLSHLIRNVYIADAAIELNSTILRRRS